MANPVHYVTEREKLEFSDTYDEPGWYFWDETWVARYGPFPTETSCEEKLGQYVKEVLGE